ncbi:MAG: BMP family ABC transporter substrate-binding protein [Blautia sp.]|uniref:BMP family ABC transporter substrate-binding protein n=1 Tax=Blautia sp. TaxID=1955243 RepID=UPI002E7A0516|nr:BMP family ABC transporter substrate-binding protein [Blautia sp.]MEE1442026.1 BMP family ABC transporter substrate-binding protein [Blautia sp.]
MADEDYAKAQKLGKKEYQSRMMRGLQPTLEVLDDILPPKGSYSEVPLGLVQIPSNQIVGTRTDGRSNAFASNFMPILKQNSEFARKWATLSTSHLEEGIREPIKAYEYMNKFYVEEGNKRVSVAKYFDVDSIPGTVIRIVPKRTNEKENVIYYEYMDFYNVSKVNYLYMSKVGNFPKLQAALGKEPGEMWSDEDRENFSSVFYRFQMEYRAKGGDKLSITEGDAFLAFLSVYGYEELLEKTTSELNDLVAKTWEEFLLLETEDVIDLKMDPTKEKKPLLSRILPTSVSRLKVAFIYAKTPVSSAWIYAHELGRLYLEQAFPDEITTFYYDNATQENIDNYIEAAINCGSNIIFTTSPSFAQASVKAAIENPEVRILNCSLNTSHRYIRTYYARMHEAKFLMGALAGALTTNDKLAYVGDYPIYGSIANINAFAIGAKMVNPRAKVYLEWSSMKDIDIAERLKEIGAGCISGKDMVIPEESTREFGLYTLDGEHTRSLAMPLWHWGKFYEQLICTIMDGTWKYDDNSYEKKAINYWWGMSAGVIDVICSKNIPAETKRLMELLKQSIVSQQFSPFSGVLYSQNGMVQGDPKRRLTPEEIITMDWLAENVVGIIPKTEDLQEQAKPVTLQQGVNKEKGQI